jgi:hypothetical protein
MRMAAGPSSLAEIPEALFAPLRSGGKCVATPPEPACGGGVSRTGDRPPREPTDRGAAARGDVRSERRELDRCANVAAGSPRKRGQWPRHQSGPPG